MSERLQRYDDFWPFYLREHSKATTRGFHYFGTSLGILIALYALVSMTWWLILVALFCGYFFAWIAHFFIEKNRPATFTYPFWSLVSDFRMFFLWLAGRLEPELRKAGIR